MFKARSISSDSQYPNIEQFMRSIPQSPIEGASFTQKNLAQNKQSHFPLKKVVGFANLKERRTSIAQLLELPLPRTPSITLNYNKNVSNDLFPQISSVTENLMKSDDKSETGSLFNGKYNSGLHNDHSMVLKQLIKKYKIKSIVQNFVSKIKRVSVLNNPVEYGEQNPYNKGLLYRKKGYSLPQVLENAFSILSIIQLMVFSFMFSTSLVYPQLKSSRTVFNLQLFSCVFLIFQIAVNLFTVKYSSGKKLQFLIDIWHVYAKGYLMIDVLSVLVLVVSFVSNSQVCQLFKIVVLFKIPQCKEKMERLQGQFIKNLYNEQYWSLVKILIFNFTFAHIISILLMGMTKLSEGSNWMSLKDIEYAPWYQKYSWSYYWANTIMLTVGFGDLVATNYKEAICLVFIQTFSCMAFAYNINCIGSLVQQITSKDAERSQKSKIFTKLNSKNNLSETLSWKINNYIEETAQLRKNFNYEEEKAFITNLPAQMKRQYLKESNKNIFQHINFFKNFIGKTLINLAERIEMKVSHPQEIIQNLQADFNLTILKTGRFGFVYRRPNFEIKDVLDVMAVGEKGNPALVNLQFILRKRPFYEIKSLEYAIYYFLPYEKLIEVLKGSSMDYELFCVLRDRIKNIPDQFQVFKCSMCAGKHLRALCPKLHYIPFHQTIIHRYLHNERTQINYRVETYCGFERLGRSKNVFEIYKKYVENVERNSVVQVSHRRRRRGEVETQITDLSPKDTVDRDETEVEKEIKIINEKYKCITNEIIKEEINKLMRSDNCEDEIWMLKNDVLYDFNAYFPEQNASNIAKSYTLSAELFKSEKLLKVTNNKTKQLITTKMLAAKSQSPKLRNSQSPKLRNSQSPKLRNSQSPKLRNSRKFKSTV